MKKLLSLILCVLLCVPLAACGKDELPQTADTRVRYHLTVPQSTDENSYPFSFDLPFYRLAVTDEALNTSLKQQSRFTAGKDLILNGQGTAQLNGAEVTIGTTLLSDWVGDWFYERLAIAYQVEVLGYSSEKDAEVEIVRKLMEIVPEVHDKMTLYTMHLLFEGSVKEEIRIESFDIPSLNFHYDFDDLSLKTTAVDPSIISEDQCLPVRYKAKGNLFSDSYLYGYGYYYIEGEAAETIKTMDTVSLDEENEVSYTMEYQSYTDLENAWYGELFLGQENEARYRPTDLVQISYRYLYDAEELRKEGYDTTCASLSVRYVLMDGREVWGFVYQPTVIHGEYLILDYVTKQLS